MYDFYKQQLCMPRGYITKLLLIMRLTTLILITAIMQVSASSFAQKITLSEKNAPLMNILDKIRDQSSYDFIVDGNLLKNAKTVDIRVKDAELKDVLNKVFERQALNFEIQGKIVVISKRETSVFDDINDFINRNTGEGRYQQQIDVLIHMKDAKGNPLPGGSAYVYSTKKYETSDQEGVITLKISKDEKVRFTYVGYVAKDVVISAIPDKGAGGVKTINVVLEQTPLELKEVAIEGSNGYQNLPKERSTGAFEVITAKQLQHSNDPNLLKRLEGITTSLVFNYQNVPNNSADGAAVAEPSSQFLNSPLTNLTIRGKNTLNSLGQVQISGNASGIPLVVIDGVASPYDISVVNPDDVESITILKDAAAASIWGSRAANGVLVVKTKRGQYNAGTRVSFNSNINISEKLDLFYQKKMSIADYVEAQKFAYNTVYPGAYPTAGSYIPNPDINAFTPQRMLSPVWEIMNTQKMNSNTISIAQRDAQLDALKGNDIRNDYNKYLARNPITQNYSLGIYGGSKNINYNLSGRYTNTLNNTINSGSNGINISYSVAAKPLKNLELTGSIIYGLQKSNSQPNLGLISPANLRTPFYPYTRLVDNQGNPAEVPQKYRPGYIDLLESKYGNNILSMRYNPLDDINEGYQKSKNQTVGLNLGANYQALSWLNANVNYSYNTGNIENELYYSQNSYLMRYRINMFTSPGSYTRNLPLGGAYSPRLMKSNNQNLRGQLNVDKTWNEKHEFNAIAGVDISQSSALNRSDSYLGYDPQTHFFTYNVDYNTNFTSKIFRDPVTQLLRILPIGAINITDSRTRTFSVFSNGAYTYDKRYTISASIRKDGSSDFGPGTNKTGYPSYHFGARWTINNEKFYHVDWLPVLAIRATFGYNGNVNPSQVAQPTVVPSQLATDITGFSHYGQLTGISNRNLRPEKTGQLDFGLDFGLKGGRISGSFDYYDKKTTDLITSNIVDPSFGFGSDPYFNTGNIRGRGIDFTLNTVNIKSGLFTWNSTFLFSYNRVKVTKLYVAGSKTAQDVIDGGSFPYDVGYDLTRIFAYKWAGLDPLTGDPRGYSSNGEKVKISNDNAGRANYNDIALQSQSAARYFGSAVPVYYGSFRNSFSYGNLTVSANFVYKLGYYFKRPDVVKYADLFGTLNTLQPAEYERRWQNPGDELKTNVPSLVYATDQGQNLRDNFYRLSEINVQKGDHVRLQEINLSYGFKTKQNWFIKNPRISANIPLNLIVWRANKFGLDPDIYDYPAAKTYGFGFSASF